MSETARLLPWQPWRQNAPQWPAKGQQIETESAPMRYAAELLGLDTDSERAIRWPHGPVLRSAGDQLNGRPQCEEDTLMPVQKDIAGQRFGRLRGRSRVGSNKHRQSVWLFDCDCGNETTATIGHVTSGHTQSCGCLHQETLLQDSVTHGHTRANKETDEFASWTNMHARCIPTTPAMQTGAAAGLPYANAGTALRTSLPTWVANRPRNMRSTASTMTGLTARKTAAGRRRSSKPTTRGTIVH